MSASFFFTAACDAPLTQGRLFHRLYGNQISDVSALCAAVVTNTALTNLKFGPDCYLMLVSFIDCLQVRLFYSLGINQISDVSALGAALATNATLTTLT